MISWGDDDEDVPAKLCMFLDLENSQFMTDEEHEQCRSEFQLEGDGDNEVCAPNTYQYLTRSKWVIVQSCLSHSERGDEKKSDYHVHSDIASYFQVESTWRLLPIESITGPAYCVEVGMEED